MVNEYNTNDGIFNNDYYGVVYGVFTKDKLPLKSTTTYHY